MPRVLLLLFCLILSPSLLAMPISYQGQLQEQGEPFTGTADLEFRLFDSETEGNQIGPAVLSENLPIFDGVFSVELDFGSGAFGASQRYLEIWIDGAPLTPRQPVTAAPVALYALDADLGHRYVLVNAKGTASENGDALIEALNMVTQEGPSAEAPWVVDLGPGVFDVGDTILNLPDHIRFSGKGKKFTTIISYAGERAIDPCSHCVIADFFLDVRPSPDVQDADGIEGSATNVEIYGLKVKLETEATTGGANAITFFGEASSDITIRNTDLELTANNSISHPLNLTGVSGNIVLTGLHIVSKSNSGRSDALLLTEVGHVTLVDSVLESEGTGLKGDRIQSLSINDVTINSNSPGRTAKGISLLNVQTLVADRVKITTQGNFSRGFEAFADGETEADFSIHEIGINSTGTDVNGMVIRSFEEASFSLSLNDSHIYSHISEGENAFTFSGEFRGPTDGAKLELDFSDVIFQATRDPSRDGLPAPNGIRMHQVIATFLDVSSIAENLPISVDWDDELQDSELVIKRSQLDASINNSANIDMRGRGSLRILQSQLSTYNTDPLLLTPEISLSCTGNVMTDKSTGASTFSATGCPTKFFEPD